MCQKKTYYTALYMYTVIYASTKLYCTALHTLNSASNNICCTAQYTLHSLTNILYSAVFALNFIPYAYYDVTI